MYLIQRDALPVCCQQTLLRVISFPEKNMNQPSQASSYKMFDAFRICQKAKQAFISAFLDLKAKHKGRRRKLKWRKQGAELDLGLWVFCVPRVWFSRMSSPLGWYDLGQGGFSSSLSSVFLFWFPLPSHKGRETTATSGFLQHGIPSTYLQNSLILQCREEQMALIMEEKMLSQANALQV